MTEVYPFANQNQMYARFIELCGQYRIVKPSKYMVSLLQEDEVSRRIRLQGEAVQLQLLYEQLPEVESDTADAMRVRDKVTPLVEYEKISFPGDREFLGSRGVCVLLDLLGDLPKLRELDLSSVGNVYAVDQCKQSPSGNDVVLRLCRVVAAHCSISAIDIRRHSVGTVAGIAILEAIMANKRIVRFDYDHAGVDNKVHEKIKRALELNVEAQPSLGAIVLPDRISDDIKRLAFVDRKTSKERLLLRQLLWEIASFSFLTAQEVEACVEQASVVTMHSAVNSCRGLRGDDEHLFLIENGEMVASIGSDKVVLGRGTYLGEQCSSSECTSGTVKESSRTGVVFKIPVHVLHNLFHAWNTKVDTLYSKIYRTPCFQSLPLWCIYHACHDAELLDFNAGDVVVAAGDAFRGLFVVVRGTFAANGNHGKVVFSSGDVFGQESLIGKRKTSSIAISCEELDAETRLAHPTFTDGCVARVPTALVHGPLKPVLKALTRPYSIHDDLSS